MNITKHSWRPSGENGVECESSNDRIDPMKRTDATCDGCGAYLDIAGWDVDSNEDLDEIYYFYEKARGE